MTKCLNAGDLNANGPCTLFTDVNAHGLNMYECAEFLYVPASCPDAPTDGTINAGSAFAKIASVDGTVPNVCVQRDANGIGAVTGLDLDVDPCDHLGTRIREAMVSIGNGDGANDPGAGLIASNLRLRGHGDLVANGGTELAADVGFFDIIREGTQDGITRYANTGTGNNQGHLFQIFDIVGVVTQDLMLLDFAGGTLYFPAWTYVSDVRLKQDVQELNGEKALKVVVGIKPISYTMHGKRYQGFSAQNVKEVLPDAVEETKGGTMTMRDGDIVANLVAAVTFLLTRVEALEAKVGV